MPKSRIFFVCLVGLVILFAVSGYSQQNGIDAYPSRPVTFIIPYPPGGGTELACRLMAKEAEKYLGQPIVTLNKTGTAVGTTAISVAKPDGYTLGVIGPQASFCLPFLENVPYHPVRDFKQIMQFGGINHGIIVTANSPFKNFGDLLAHARQNPGKVTWGAIPGGLPYIVTEQIATKEKVKLTHIPFRGPTEMEPALLGGHIHFGAGDFSYSLIEAGQTRLLLLLREEPAPEYPQAPVLKDLGYGDIPAPAGLYIVAPKSVPGSIARKLEGVFTKAARDPDFVKGMRNLRIPIVYRGSQELEEYVLRNYEFFRKYLKK